VEPLVDLHLPVSAKGRAFALGAAGFGAAKRAVKRSPTLWKLALRARAALAGRRG
jgi:CelD/BcsL family acetyltransferase involved in cellulose biosynthesis